MGKEARRRARITEPTACHACQMKRAEQGQTQMSMRTSEGEGGHREEAEIRRGQGEGEQGDGEEAKRGNACLAVVMIADARFLHYTSGSLTHNLLLAFSTTVHLYPLHSHVLNILLN